MISSKKTKASSSSNPNQLSSADIIASNDDILTLILHCLPLKSLLKFKSVSKHWLSLITDPSFRPKHSNSTTVSGLFVRRISGRTNPKYDFINLSPHPSRAPFRSLAFVHDPHGINILQSCNGLLLCSSFRANCAQRIYYIYNPTTKHYTVLPPLLRNNITFGVSLAFDPSRSPHYKVICISNHDPDLPNHYHVEIYSSETGGPWRSLGRSFLEPSHVQFKNGVFHNGAIHWLSNWGDNSLCFDVEEEEIRDIPMPLNDEDLRPCRYFGESGGHLHLVEVYDPYKLEFNVYEMERNNSGWFVKYKVDLNPVAAAFPEMARGYVDPIDNHSYAFSILCVVHQETEEGSFMVLHIPNKAVRYDFKDHGFRKIHDFAPSGSRVDNDSFVSNCFDAHQFIESFACV